MVIVILYLEHAIFGETAVFASLAIARRNQSVFLHGYQPNSTVWQDVMRLLTPVPKAEDSVPSISRKSCDASVGGKMVVHGRWWYQYGAKVMYGHSWPFAAIHGLSLSFHTWRMQIFERGTRQVSFICFAAVFPVSDISQTHLFDRIQENHSHWYKTNQRTEDSVPSISMEKCYASGWCGMIVDSRWVVHCIWLVHGTWLVHGPWWPFMVIYGFHGHSILRACSSWGEARAKSCWTWLIKFNWILS